MLLWKYMEVTQNPLIPMLACVTGTGEISMEAQFLF